MRLEGRVFKVGKSWAIEVPILGVVTQGKTKREAYEMIADAIESLVNKKDFKVQVHTSRGEYFEIQANDNAALIAFLLRRQRIKNGLSLQQVAKLLGARSNNSYARYEQGSSVPSMEKFSDLLAAVSSNSDFVLSKSRLD